MAEHEKVIFNMADFIIEENYGNLITNEAEHSDVETIVAMQQQNSKVVASDEKCHTMIIRQTTTTNQNKTAKYFYCLECKKDFDTIKDFSAAHETVDYNEVDNIIVMDNDDSSEQWQNVDDSLQETIKEELEEVENFEEITIEDYQLHAGADTARNYVEQVDYENDVDNAQNEIEYVANYDDDDDDVDDDDNDDDVDDDDDDDNGGIVYELFEAQEVDDDDNDDDDDDDSDKAKFCCIDCETLFDDYAVAENHDCLATKKSTNNTKMKIYENAVEVKRKSTPNSFICEYCGLNINLFSSLKKHLQRCTSKNNTQLDENNIANNNRFICSKCPKSFTTITALSNHGQTHRAQTATHSVAPIKTKNVHVNAQKTANNASQSKKSANLNGHYDISADEDSATELSTRCDICNTEFPNIRSLKLHAKMHRNSLAKTIEDALPAGAKYQYSELNQFYCEICQKSFNENLLEIHKNMHRNLEEYTCKVCNRQFENLPSYEVHVQMHTEKAKKKPAKSNKQQQTERPDGTKLTYKCQYCGYAFLRPYEKIKHERVHTGEKPYECEVCGKKFRVAYSLTLHLRSHTNIRPFVCATCKKRFKSKPAYEHHLNTHRAERLYKCHICPKSFHTSVQLCAHKNTHDKPFNCPECNRPYASLFYVKVHMKTHIKSNKSNVNLKYRCAVCGAVYARTSALRAHLSEMHKVDKDACNQAMELRYVQDITMLQNDNDNDNSNNIDELNAAGISDEKEEVEEEDFETSMQKIIESCCNEKQIGNENEEIKVDDNIQCEEVVC